MLEKLISFLRTRARTEKTNYEIISLTSVDSLSFGSTRDEVRRHFAGERRTFTRNQLSIAPTDHFVDRGIFAEYDTEGRLIAIEMARPARAMFQGVDLLSLDFGEFQRVLRAMDPALMVDLDGAISHSLGVGAWVALAKKGPTAPCKTVIAFRRDYYTQDNSQ